MKHIIENATIFYRGGEKKICDAIRITKKGIYTGCLITKRKQKEIFEDHGFIPRTQIKKIIVFNQHGKIKDIDF